jgi:Ca-activated chloride channel homolog
MAIVRSRSPARFLTLVVASLALGLACSKEQKSESTDGVTEAGDPGVNYGDERIGFKQQSNADVEGASAALADASPASAAGAPLIGADGIDVTPATPVPGAAPPSALEPDLGIPGEPPPDLTAAPAPTTVPAVVPTIVPTVVPTAVSPDGGPPAGDAGVVARGDAGPPVSSLDAGSESDAGAPEADAGLFSSVTLRQELPTPAPAPNAAVLQPENPFRITESMPASTFAIDVDTGSYTLARAALNQGALPNPSTVRIEEFINYFHLHYAQPAGDVPFSVYSELGECPWDATHQLMLVGIQGQEVPLETQPAANLVFLLDVSGSMNEPAKLPLLKKGFRMLTRLLRPIDKVSIVTYAGADRVVLEGVSGDQKDTINAALDQLTAGGSTNGEGGINRAYAIAQEQFIQGGNNRVILATDGDFNVGLSATEDLAQFISTKRDSGVFLSVYGFGSPLGNYQDANAEQLANNGNGVYFFVDGPEEARRAFIHTVTGSLLTVAKDVKLQLEFNPDQVLAYRLIGYENRVLANSDFSNDSVDAGELGAGLSVTALFELVKPGSDAQVPHAAPGTDPLEAVAASADPAPVATEPEFEPVQGKDLVALRIRYKGRDAAVSQLITGRYTEAVLRREAPTKKFSYAAAVAELAMQLRGSQYLPERRTNELYADIEFALPASIDGAVEEFLGLAKKAHGL